MASGKVMPKNNNCDDGGDGNNGASCIHATVAMPAMPTGIAATRAAFIKRPSVPPTVRAVRQLPHSC